MDIKIFAIIRIINILSVRTASRDCGRPGEKGKSRLHASGAIINLSEKFEIKRFLSRFKTCMIYFAGFCLYF